MSARRESGSPPPALLKVGGNELDDPAFLSGLARAIASLGPPLVVVHGGGRAIGELQERLGIRPARVDGLRVTDAASLAVAEMVLSGQLNKRIVAALLAAGVDAVGLSGIDGGLLRCRPRQHPTADLGYVGEIVTVRVTLLTLLLNQGICPVVSPISLGPAGQAYNVNADEAAGAIGLALGAPVVTFLSNVPGVGDGNGAVLTRLDGATAERLVAAGVIGGGMAPKVRAALAVARGGVNVRITNLGGLLTGVGTIVENSHEQR
jgi:acetylglutamate kinase